MSEIPELSLKGGVKVRVVCGEVEGTRGPVRDIVTDPSYLDVTVPAGTRYAHPTPPGHTVFAYVIEGSAVFCEGKDPYSYEAVGTSYFDLERKPALANESLALFGDGEEIVVTTEAEPVRFLLVSGKPIGEPVAWYGPIVMNTQDELRIAFEEYQNGTFIKRGGA